MTTEKKKEITKVELEQFKNVLSHPAFQSNPVGAITEHLKNSVALMQKKHNEETVKKTNKNKNKKKPNKSKQSNAMKLG